MVIRSVTPIRRAGEPTARMGFLIFQDIELDTSTLRPTKGINGADFSFTYPYGLDLGFQVYFEAIERNPVRIMTHINLKSAGIAESELPVDVSVTDLPRVNAVLAQLVAAELPQPGPVEPLESVQVFPPDVQALGLPQEPRFYGQLFFSRCPGTQLTLIHGTLTGQLPLRCQSCLSPFIHQLSLTLDLAHVTREDQEKHVPEGYDMLLIDRQDVSLSELLEDDILLALPAFPRHPAGQCHPGSSVERYLEPTDIIKSPFATLKTLLSGSKTES